MFDFATLILEILKQMYDMLLMLSAKQISHRGFLNIFSHLIHRIKKFTQFVIVPLKSFSQFNNKEDLNRLVKMWLEVNMLRLIEDLLQLCFHLQSGMSVFSEICVKSCFRTIRGPSFALSKPKINEWLEWLQKYHEVQTSEPGGRTDGMMMESSTEFFNTENRTNLLAQITLIDKHIENY